MRAWAGSAMLSIALVLSLGGVAEARGFRVYTCTSADGRAMGPTIDGVQQLPSGWSWSYAGYLSGFLTDRCPVADRFEFRVQGGAPMSAGQSIWARWTAALGTQLTGVTSWWEGASDLNAGRGQGTGQLTVGTDQQTLLAQNSPLFVSFGYQRNPAFQAPVRPAQWFEIRFTCLNQCSTTDVTTILVHVLIAQFEVDDSSPPTGGLVGTGTDAQTWSGSTRLGLNAADVGAGVARAVVESDGVDALAISLDDPDGNCHDIGPDPAVAEYAAARPCPLRIDNGSLDIDTAKLPQGRHVVRVLLEDAAGNRTPIFGPLTRNIAAGGAIGPGSDPALRGAANGDGASDEAALTAHWGKRGQRKLLVSRFGRTHVVRGRLRTQDGAPIANAAIDVVSKTTANNARELGKRGGPRTRSDGSWYLVLPRRVSSRDVTFRYRSHTNDTIPSATARVRLRVRAGLRLAIHPRRARQGQVIRFNGRLLGGPLPRGGKQIVLMARASHGAWVRFNVVRTDRRGRFHAGYRFQQPGAALYRFRALSLAEAAYPYLAGGSNVVIVRKR